MLEMLKNNLINFDERKETIQLLKKAKRETRTNQFDETIKILEKELFKFYDRHTEILSAMKQSDDDLPIEYRLGTVDEVIKELEQGI